jgi:hypothetical protein
MCKALPCTRPACFSSPSFFAATAVRTITLSHDQCNDEVQLCISAQELCGEDVGLF